MIFQIPISVQSNCAKFNNDFENGGDFNIRTSLNDEKKPCLSRTL